MTSLGSGREAFWDALEQGSSGARRILLDRVGDVTACVVEDLDTSAIDRREARRLDRAGLLAALAAAPRHLTTPAAPSWTRPGSEPVIANAHGGAETIHRGYAEFFGRGADRISPFTVPLA